MGIGNELRMDDAVGLMVVQALGKGKKCGNIDFYGLGDDLEALPILISGKPKAAVVDALQSGRRPGRIRTIRADPACLPAGGEMYSLHELELIWQIGYAYQNGFQGELLLIGIETARVEPGIGLSPELEKLFPRIVKNVGNILASFSSGPKTGKGASRSRDP
ncbi:MAG: hydrogenase maturation protease [Bacillota bacterium]